MGEPLPCDAPDREHTEQGGCVNDARPPVVGVCEPLESGSAPAEHRDGVSAPGIAERQVRQEADRNAGRPAGTHRRKHAASVSQGDVLGS